MSAFLFRFAAICAAFLALLSVPSLAQNVPYQRIVQAGNTPNDWVGSPGTELEFAL